MPAEIMKYNPDQIAFYGTLGHAIITWSQVERALYMVYYRAVGSPMSLTPPAAFFSAINFNTKLAMVDNVMAVRYYHYPDVLARWTTIKNGLGKRAKRRNFLAHWQLLIGVQPDGTMVHQLVPQIFDPNQTRDGKRPEMSVADIEALDLKFRDCAAALDALAEDLRETSRPEFRGLEDDHPLPQTPDGPTDEGQ